MDIISIVTIIGAVAAVIGTVYAIQNSKGSILRRIDRKEEQIRRINHALVLKYGLNRGFGPMDSLDVKKEKLQNQITELRRRL